MKHEEEQSSSFLKRNSEGDLMILNSKVYVQPRKRVHIFGIVLNICLVFMALSCAFKFLMEGFDWRTFSTLILLIVIRLSYQSRDHHTAKYEFALVDVAIYPQYVNLTYKDVDLHDGKGAHDQIVSFETNTITALEYSDQLCCLRIVGKIQITENLVPQVKRDAMEHLFYIEKGMEQQILAQMSSVARKNIIFIDRNATYNSNFTES